MTNETTVDRPPFRGARAGPFEQFYASEHEGQVRRAYLLLGSAAAAHDVVADAFVSVLSRWGTIDEPGPYLNRCVVNGCHDHWRTAPREQALGVSEAEDTPWLDHIDEIAELLLDLPFRQRAALVLRYYGGFRNVELAELLDCPTGTVASLIHRGLRALEPTLAQEDDR